MTTLLICVTVQKIGDTYCVVIIDCDFCRRVLVMAFHVPEKFRIKKNAGVYNSSQDDGNNGFFIIKSLRLKTPLRVIASDGAGWEHVSVSLQHGKRCPKWSEMCFIKELFWDKTDTVLQYHPAEKDYISHHPYCLHLWRPVGQMIPTPPPVLVGPVHKTY